MHSKGTEPTKERFYILLCSVLIFCFYVIIFKQFFPNKHGLMGHDYSYFIPHMLSGYYWFKVNGLFAIPWFTPAFCGGSIVFPNPACTYFSVPQFFAFFINPFQSVLLTVILFAGVGFAGAYLLLRRVFFCSRWVSLLGGTLFLFNGFFIYRLIVGHIFAHAFMFVPLMAYLLIYKEGTQITRMKEIFKGATAGLLFAYLFYTGGGGYLSIPIFLSLVVIALICVIRGMNLRSLFIRWSVFIISVMLFSLAKITAVLYAMKNLSRNTYPFVGVESISNAIMLTFRSLFWDAMKWEEAKQILAEPFVVMRCHEFEYGISLVPFVLIILGLFSFIRREHHVKREKRIILLSVMCIAFIFFIPVVFTYSSPEWYKFLKEIPVLKQYSAFFRWNILYILPIITISVLCLDYINIKYKWKTILSLSAIIAVVLINIGHDKKFYENQPFDPRPVIEAYEFDKENNQVRPIKYVGSGINGIPIDDDRLMVYGVSQISCYDPIYGYWNEFLPGRESLTPGPVEDVKDGYFNIKNPACLAFPDENSCVPGERFREDQRTAMLNFINYQSFGFNLPLIQHFADWATSISLILFAALLFIKCLSYLLKYVPINSNNQ